MEEDRASPPTGAPQGASPSSSSQFRSSTSSQTSATGGAAGDGDAAKTAREVVESMASTMQAQADQGMQAVTGQAHTVANTMRGLADELEEGDNETLGRYVGQWASQLERFAGSLERMSAQDLMAEASRVARENPAMFLAGSVAVGFAASRFFRLGGSALTQGRVGDGGKPDSSPAIVQHPSVGLASGGSEP